MELKLDETNTNLINSSDKPSSDEKYQDLSTLEENLYDRKLRVPLFMINPEGKFYVCWQVIMLFFIMYSALVIPVRIPFENKPHLFFLIFDTIMDFLFAVDILFNFNTAFEDAEANMVTNRK